MSLVATSLALLQCVKHLDRLNSDLMKKFQKVHIVRLFSEVQLENIIDTALQTK